MAGETKDVWVALMGVTGSGKSTFISHCTEQKATVGIGLQSCTRNVEVYSFTYRPGVRVHLVDTPGFDDTNRQDAAVLGEISGWLSKTYTEQIYLSGILYFHRISDIRMQGTGKMNMWLLRKLCGRGAVNKVVLTTTMWELVEKSTAPPSRLFEENDFTADAQLDELQGSDNNGLPARRTEDAEQGGTVTRCLNYWRRDGVDIPSIHRDAAGQHTIILV